MTDISKKLKLGKQKAPIQTLKTERLKPEMLPGEVSLLEYEKDSTGQGTSRAKEIAKSKAEITDLVPDSSSLVPDGASLVPHGASLVPNGASLARDSKLAGEVISIISTSMACSFCHRVTGRKMKTEINQSKAEIRKAAISKTEILKVESRNQPSQKAEN